MKQIKTIWITPRISSLFIWSKLAFSNPQQPYIGLKIKNVISNNQHLSTFLLLNYFSVFKWKTINNSFFDKEPFKTLPFIIFNATSTLIFFLNKTIIQNFKMITFLSYQQQATKYSKVPPKKKKRVSAQQFNKTNKKALYFYWASLYKNNVNKKTNTKKLTSNYAFLIKTSQYFKSIKKLKISAQINTKKFNQYSKKFKKHIKYQVRKKNRWLRFNFKKLARFKKFRAQQLLKAKKKKKKQCTKTPIVYNNNIAKTIRQGWKNWP